MTAPSLVVIRTGSGPVPARPSPRSGTLRAGKHPLARRDPASAAATNVPNRSLIRSRIGYGVRTYACRVLGATGDADLHEHLECVLSPRAWWSSLVRWSRSAALLRKAG